MIPPLQEFVHHSVRQRNLQGRGKKGKGGSPRLRSLTIRKKREGRKKKGSADNSTLHIIRKEIPLSYSGSLRLLQKKGEKKKKKRRERRGGFSRLVCSLLTGAVFFKGSKLLHHAHLSDMTSRKKGRKKKKSKTSYRRHFITIGSRRRKGKKGEVRADERLSSSFPETPSAERIADRRPTCSERKRGEKEKKEPGMGGRGAHCKNCSFQAPLPKKRRRGKKK